MEEFCPVPFPEGLPTIQLERISLAKLLDDDDLEASRLFDVCTKEGGVMVCWSIARHDENDATLEGHCRNLTEARVSAPSRAAKACTHYRKGL